MRPTGTALTDAGEGAHLTREEAAEPDALSPVRRFFALGGDALVRSAAMAMEIWRREDYRHP